MGMPKPSPATRLPPNDANGGPTEFRAGTNGWVCLPDDPATPGTDPMCADSVWQAWLEAHESNDAAVRTPLSDREEYSKKEHSPVQVKELDKDEREKGTDHAGHYAGP
jgi:hypothetical protein